MPCAQISKEICPVYPTVTWILLHTRFLLGGSRSRCECLECLAWLLPRLVLLLFPRMHACIFCFLCRMPLLSILLLSFQWTLVLHFPAILFCLCLLLLGRSGPSFSHCFLTCSLYWPSPDILVVFCGIFAWLWHFLLYCVFCSCCFTLIVMCALVVNLCMLVWNFSWTNLLEQFVVIAIVCGWLCESHVCLVFEEKKFEISVFSYH